MSSLLSAIVSPTPDHAAGLYVLYGLRIRSSLPLPCPHIHDDLASPDVELFECSEEEIENFCFGVPVHVEDDGYWQDIVFSDGVVKVNWRGHFEFAVSAGRHQVLWRRWEGVPDEALFTYLLGHVLTYCLLARGSEPLHATCVAIEGEAVAFAGDSGYGKSTLAAALLARGYSLLTDDVLLLEFQGDQVFAHPSLARIKLMPESADVFLEGRRSIPMNGFTSKMVFTLEDSKRVATPVPLRAVYLLPARSASSAITIRRVRGRAAFLSIIKNTFNNVVLAPERLKQQFAFAAHLESRVPIKRISYPKRMELLPSVVDALLADILRESNCR